MVQIDKVMMSFDISRRLLLGTLNNPARTLIKMTKSAELGPPTAQLVVNAEDYTKRLLDLADLMDTAGLRLGLSLCELPDMAKLLKAARASANA